MNLNLKFSSRTFFALAIAAAVAGLASCKKELSQPEAVIPADSTAVSATAAGQTAFSFTEIPYSSTDLINPGRGVEQWHNANEVNVPTQGVNTPRMDVYYRFPWTRLEGATQGSYNWTYFDGLVKSAINKKQKFSFGIMTVFPGANTSGGLVSYGSGYSCYPLYLHNLMQSESVKDWRKGSTWVPNYNSNHYLSRLLALHQAINQHLEVTTYNGVKFKDVIGYIDVRGYGSWGEWHHGSVVNTMNEFPSGTRATTATLKKIIDTHTQGFPNYNLVIMIAAFDANRLPMIMNPTEVGYYALTTRNNAGPIGWRRDQWGATDSYLSDYLERNNASFNGVVLKDLIMNRWKTSPIVGEPPSWNDNNYAALEKQIRLYHATSFGNGNYGVTPNTTIANNVRAAAKASGYRIKLLSGEAPSTMTRNTPVTIKTVWQNVGIAPTYETWDVMFELQDASNVVKASGKSTRVLKLYLPETAGSTTTDTFTVPSTVPTGTYKLVVRVKDPKNYRPNMQLAINGRNADGSYTLLKTVTVR